MPDKPSPIFDDDALEAEMEVLRGAFVERLPSQITGIKDAAAGISAAPDWPSTSVALTQLERAAHGISGSSALFGFPALAGAAADLEEACLDMIAGEGPRRAVEQRIPHLVQALLEKADEV